MRSRVIYLALMCAVVASVPPFLTGTLSADIGRELRFSPAGIGSAAAAYFFCTSASAWLLGQVVERRGLRFGLAVGLGLTCSSFAILAAAPGVLWIAVGLAIAGVGNGMTSPAINAVIAGRVAPRRLGMAIGIKQASIPTAILFAGLAVPTVGRVAGWRPTMVLGSLMSGVLALAVLCASSFERRPHTTSCGAALRLPALRSGPLRALAIASGCAAAASVSLGTLGVDFSVVVGIDPGAAGTLIAIASGLGLVVRLAIGWLADAYPTMSRYGLASGLVTLGAAGYFVLAGSTTVWLLSLGLILGYGAGWAWPGLVNLIAVRHAPAQPAASSGVVQTGSALGGTVGPFIIGSIADWRGYSVAWLVAALLAAISAIFFRVGRRMHRRELVERIEIDPQGRSHVLALRKQYTISQSMPHCMGAVSRLEIGPGRYHADRCDRDTVLVVLDGGDLVFTSPRHPDSLTVSALPLSIPTGLVWRVTNAGTTPVSAALVPRHENCHE